MAHIASERRSYPRLQVACPCKVYDPVANAYYVGEVMDLSNGGANITLDRSVSLIPGDHLMLGIAEQGRHGLLRSADMIESVIVRTLRTGQGQTVLGLRFSQAPRDVIPTLRLAA